MRSSGGVVRVSRRGGRRSGMRCIVILVLLCVSISACATLPPKPPRPTLAITETEDSGVCLDRHNTLLLMQYIYALEQGYQ
jgi:hypothetical protein